MIFTGVIGGFDSQFGSIALGYDQADLIFVTWIRSPHADDGEVEQFFGFDESGFPIRLMLGIPGLITKSEAKRLRDEGYTLTSTYPLSLL